MPNCKIVQFQPLEDGAAYCFGNVDGNMLADELAQFWGSRGYKLESGTPAAAVWGTGSDVLRIFFGGFVKRYKFNVAIEPQPPGVLWVRISKGMSGAMGGVLGYSAMKRETDRIVSEMQQFFS